MNKWKQEGWGQSEETLVRWDMYGNEGCRRDNERRRKTKEWKMWFEDINWRVGRKSEVRRSKSENEEQRKKTEGARSRSEVRVWWRVMKQGVRVKTKSEGRMIEGSKVEDRKQKPKNEEWRNKEE